jgi:hypothetical protein
MKLATVCSLTLPIIAAGLLFTTQAPAQPPVECCIVPSVNGTAEMPGHCQYAGTMEIVDGLAAGDTIFIDAVIEVTSSLNLTGTPPTGTTEEFSGNLYLTLQGSGTLSAFSRNITINLAPAGPNKTQSDPRTPFAPIQPFPNDLLRMHGQIFGDPDFDLLRVTGGTEFGMPSPGFTTLYQSGSMWIVDSFFDVFHRVDFVGAPTGALAGRSGSTTRQRRFSTCPLIPVPVEATTWGGVKARFDR